MGMDNGSDVLHQVQNYRKIVLLYEALDEEIDKLIMEHDGSMENMSEEVRDRYRQLARQRDELHNEMRVMEMRLLDEDDEEPTH